MAVLSTLSLLCLAVATATLNVARNTFTRCSTLVAQADVLALFDQPQCYASWLELLFSDKVTHINKVLAASGPSEPPATLDVTIGGGAGSEEEDGDQFRLTARFTSCDLPAGSASFVAHAIAVHVDRTFALHRLPAAVVRKFKPDRDLEPLLHRAADRELLSSAVQKCGSKDGWLLGLVQGQFPSRAARRKSVSLSSYLSRHQFLISDTVRPALADLELSRHFVAMHLFGVVDDSVTELKPRAATGRAGDDDGDGGNGDGDGGNSASQRQIVWTSNGDLLARADFELNPSRLPSQGAALPACDRQAASHQNPVESFQCRWPKPNPAVDTAGALLARVESLLYSLCVFPIDVVARVRELSVEPGDDGDDPLHRALSRAALAASSLDLTSWKRFHIHVLRNRVSRLKRGIDRCVEQLGEDQVIFDEFVDQPRYLV